MPQGTYDVNKKGAEAPQDTSFRSCICAMLIFFIICMIILLATSTIPRASDKKGPNSLQLNDSNKYSTLSSSPITTSVPSTKPAGESNSTTVTTSVSINTRDPNEPFLDERNANDKDETVSPVEEFGKDNENKFERVVDDGNSTNEPSTKDENKSNSDDPIDEVTTDDESYVKLLYTTIFPKNFTDQNKHDDDLVIDTVVNTKTGSSPKGQDNKTTSEPEKGGEQTANESATYPTDKIDDKLTNLNVKNETSDRRNEGITNAPISVENSTKIPTTTTTTTTIISPKNIKDNENATFEEPISGIPPEDKDNQRNSTSHVEDVEGKTIESTTNPKDSNNEKVLSSNVNNQTPEETPTVTPKISTTTTSTISPLNINDTNNTVKEPSGESPTEAIQSNTTPHDEGVEGTKTESTTNLKETNSKQVSSSNVNNQTTEETPTVTPKISTTTTTTISPNITDQMKNNKSYKNPTVEEPSIGIPPEDIQSNTTTQGTTAESKNTNNESLNVKNVIHDQTIEETTAESSTKMPITTTTSEAPGTDRINVLDENKNVEEPPTNLTHRNENDELKQMDTEEETFKTCSTGECKYISSRILSMMNHTVEPCTDFYEYSCGGLRNNPDLQPEDLSRDVWKRIQDGLKTSPKGDENKEKFRLFYQSCIDYSKVPYENRIKQALNVLMEMGDILNFQEEEGKFYNLTELLTNIIINNSPLFFDISVEPNEDRVMTLSLTLPPFHSPFFYPKENTKDRCKNEITDKHINLKKIYETHQKCSELNRRDEFLNETEHSLKEFNKLGKHIKRNRINIDFQILNITENQPSKSSVRHQLLMKKFRVRTIDYLSNEFPVIDWITLISTLINSSTPINGEEKIHIYFYEHFQKLFRALNNTYFDTQTPIKDFHNGILSIYARFLYEELVKDVAPCNREDYCLKLASRLLPEIAGKIYLDSFTNEQKREFQWRLETQRNAIRDHLHAEIADQNSWLDEQSRKDLINKLQNITFQINGGTEAKFESGNSLLKEFTPTTSYFENAIKLNRLYRTRLYKLYKTDASKQDIIWSLLTQPHALNTIYDYNLGIIAVPFTIFSSPMMSPKLPKYLSAARLGFTLAHDIGHHFDSIGITKVPLKKESKLKKSIDESASYLSNIFGLLKSYILPDGRIVSFNFNQDEIFLHINEFLADLTGVNTALKAYKSFIQNKEEELLLPWIGLDPDQLYFLTIAQMYCSKNTLEQQIIPLFEDKHLPPSERIAFIATNSEDFSKAFSCPPGSKMNPSSKIETFPKLIEVYDEELN